MKTRKLKVSEVTFTITTEPDDIPVRGNAMASGDAALDKEIEDWLIARLDRGDYEAWCRVRVEARWEDFVGVDYRGACSLDSKYTAAVAVKEHGMKDNALADLNAELAAKGYPMTDNEIDLKMLALAKHLDVDVSTVSECRGMGDDVYESEDAPGKYCVLTGDEADTEQRNYWTNYPDDTDMFRDWPEDAVDYFDKERWVKAQIEAENANGRRGNTLASYDGHEHKVKVGDTYYYLYRVG